MPEETISCPECGSTCCAELANVKICNQCKYQWALVRDPIGEQARKARADAVGWPAGGGKK